MQQYPVDLALWWQWTRIASSSSHVLLAPYLCLSTRQEPILAGALNLPASPLSRLRAATIWTFRGSAAHETKHDNSDLTLQVSSPRHHLPARSLTCNFIFSTRLSFHRRPHARPRAASGSRLLSVVALGPSTSPHSRHAWTRPIANHHRQCRAMLHRTTVRDETDHAHHPASPTDVLQSPPPDMAVAPQTSAEVAQMHLEAQDRNSMEAGPHSDLAHLVLVHRAETTLDVAKSEN